MENNSSNNSAAAEDVYLEAVLFPAENIPYGPILIFTGALLLVAFGLAYRYGVFERCAKLGGQEENGNDTVVSHPVIPIISHNLNNKWMTNVGLTAEIMKDRELQGKGITSVA